MSRPKILALLFLTAFAVALFQWISFRRAGEKSSPPSIEPAKSALQLPAQGTRKPETPEDTETPDTTLHRTDLQGLRITPAIPEEGQWLLTVIDQEGSPLSDVEILYYEVNYSSEIDVEWGDGFSAGVEQQLEKYGRAFHTNVDGQAALPSPETWFFLGLRTPEYFNYNFLEPVPELTVTARPPLAIPCEVHDDEGLPVPGIPVLLGVDLETETTWFQEVQSDANGLATMFVYDRFRSIEEFEDGSPLQAFASLNVLSVLEQRKLISLFQEPDRPLKFQLDGMGKVHLQLESGDGGPLAAPLQVSLFAVSEAEQGRMEHWLPGKEQTGLVLNATSDQDMVSFSRIALGQHLVAIAHSEESPRYSRKFFPGPETHGEELSMTMTIGKPSSIYEGRIIRENGGPYEDSEFPVTLWDPSGRTHLHETSNLHTDGQGRFHWTPESKFHEGMELELFIAAPESSDNPNRAVVLDLSRKARPGVHALGDLGFKSPPLLAEGIVVDAEGNGIPGAKVRLDSGVPELYRVGFTRWIPQVETNCTAGPDGRFSIYGFAKGDSKRLHGSAVGYFQNGLEFEVASEPLTLVLPRIWEVKAKILLPDSITNKQISITFHSTERHFESSYKMATLDKDGTLQTYAFFREGSWTFDSYEFPAL